MVQQALQAVKAQVVVQAVPEANEVVLTLAVIEVVTEDSLVVVQAQTTARADVVDMVHCVLCTTL
jgi:hypothetical protein